MQDGDFVSAQAVVVSRLFAMCVSQVSSAAGLVHNLPVASNLECA